jgi:hypothetical protein
MLCKVSYNLGGGHQHFRTALSLKLAPPNIISIYEEVLKPALLSLRTGFLWSFEKYCMTSQDSRENDNHCVLQVIM